MKRIIERDHIERGKIKKTAIEEFKKGWTIYQNKEKCYKILYKSKELIFKKEPNINSILKKLSNKTQ